MKTQTISINAARFQIIRETSPFDGHQTGWGVEDTSTGQMLLTEESFTIACNLADSLNGRPWSPISEVEEVAGTIRLTLS